MEDNFLIKESLQIGNINGLEVALELAELQRETGKDIDYLISSLKELIKERKAQ